MTTTRKLLTDNRGVGAIEYALVASLISLGVLAAVQSLANKVEDKFSGIDRAVAGAL